MKNDVWYLAGPMSGYPQFNVPLFFRTSCRLREMGYTVINPAELDSSELIYAALASPHGDVKDYPSTFTWGSVLGRDVEVIVDRCTGILFLPGWEDSRGARLEAYMGLTSDMDFGIIVFPEGREEDLKVVPISYMDVLEVVIEGIK